MAKNRTKNIISLLSGGIVLFVLCLLSLRFGSAHLSTREFFFALTDVKRETVGGVIIYNVRLARLLSALVAGAGLGMSGAILQIVTGNRMASPNLVGVNSGAGFAVILAIWLFPSLFAFVPLFAFCGAFLTTAFITALSRKVGVSKSNVILIGLAVSAILSAGISLISLIDTDVLVSYNAFSVGSLSGVKFEQLMIPAITVGFVLVLSCVFSQRLDILSLGDNTAHSLGLCVPRVRIFAMLLASASASSAVSFAGLLGFAGLMSPHIARRFVPENAKILIPASALIGSILVVLSDFLGRIMAAPSEIPAGILMALSGSPFFLFLLLSKGGRKDA
ncbi:MAG: iron ABC transporter permease [Clostridia bacterium]|nr:iron ABC transporter permease [Clostridia bacterium]